MKFLTVLAFIFLLCVNENLAQVQKDITSKLVILNVKTGEEKIIL